MIDRGAFVGVRLGIAMAGAAAVIGACSAPTKDSKNHGEDARAAVIVAPNGATVRLPVPPGWSAAGTTRAPELVGPHGRVLVTFEQRSTAAEAVERLDEIAREWDGPARRLTIAGGPALQRRRTAPLATPGASASQGAGDATVVTTAIAAGDLVVRLEASLAPTGDADPIEALARTIELGPPGVATAPTSEPAASVARALSNGEPQLVPAPVPPVASPGFNDRVNAGFGVDSEIEIAVSPNGQHIVTVNNTRDYVTSNDYGLTFTQRVDTAGAGIDQGDPSVAYGLSGAFYAARIRQPDGTPAANNVTGCATEVTRSIDDGVTFALRGYAFVSPTTGMTVTFPDQHHIAVDRTNASATNEDQVYSVWRDFSPLTRTPMDRCGAIGTGLVSPSIVCSTDSGATWTARAAIGTGDFPRVNVGSDGFVYVVYISGSSVMLNRYSSCANGLVQQTGFPRTVTSFTSVACATLPGLDRCNDGNRLESPTVAVDDTNANHVYVSWATNTAAGNEDVMVRDSTDGGVTWTRPAVRVNSATAGRRFMPWVCTTNGTAFVSWYDMRAAVGAATNDLTDFWGGSAALDASGTLVAGGEFRISQISDPICASGWPGGARNSNNPEACTVQPQLAGFCGDTNPMTPDSLIRCDFSTCPGGACPCPMGEACQTSRGSPKYGDYNGNACAAGRFYAAWASATSPAGVVPASTDIDVFFACPPNPGFGAVSFVDVTPPTFTSVPGPVTVADCGAVVLGTPVAIDPCGSGPVAITNDAPATFPPGVTVVTWTATDAAGNAATATQTVTVEDTTAPTFTSVPLAVVVTTCASPVLGTPTATDACGVTITSDAPAVFPLGDTVVTYTATDPAGNTATATQVVTAELGDDPSCCPAGSNVIIGSFRPEGLLGTDGPDCIIGLGGWDVIFGFDGDDVISGGPDSDVVLGGDGNDWIFGHGGNDILHAGADDDRVFGGPGSDFIAGDGGDDLLSGGNQRDLLIGGGSNDTLDGGEGRDRCLGGPGSDTVLSCE